jgi:hypothetical protein
MLAVAVLALALSSGPLVSPAWTANTREDRVVVDASRQEPDVIGNDGVDNGNDDTGDPDDWADNTPVDDGVQPKSVAPGSGTRGPAGAEDRPVVSVSCVRLRVMFHILVVTFAVR